MDKFLNDMEREKPIRFTSQKLRTATDNFTNLLGTGGFGAVYKGIISDGTVVVVKVLHGSSDKKMEEQAEVGTIGRIHHFNLVRLYGFCFEKDPRALVYEYMGNSSLDKYLFHKNKALGFEKLHEIADSTAKGIAYLHEECRQRIVHYDKKPENILLDANFFPNVADFGLAKLCNRENTHITMSMSVVVKMLEGVVEITTPLYPFRHVLVASPGPQLPAVTYVPGSGSTFDLSSSMATGSSFTCATPIMGKYEIEIATST